MGHYLTLTPLINAKILERVSLLGGLEGNKARSFVYEKFLVDYVKSFRGAFFAHLEKLRNVLHAIERPFLRHLKIDMAIAITQKEL